MPSPKFISVLNALATDWRATFRFSADVGSCFRLATDFALSRIISVVPREWRNRVRQIAFRGNIKVHYRLNKGDLHSIREIWFQEAYRLPFEVPRGVLLDLGANIGMTSVWLAKRYSFSKVIAVEPDPNNAALVRQNLETNDICGEVLEAAVGPKDATTRFEFSELSNLGKLSERGSLVPMISVASIIQKFAVPNFALAKIDIEGGEQGLFDGPTEWLAFTNAIIIEFHPTLVDYPGLIGLVSSNGFKYIPANSVFPENMDCFTKVKLTPTL